MEKNMKRIKKLAIALAALALLVSSISAQPMAIDFGVNDTSGYPNTFVKVPVNITDVQNESIVGIIFDISFNSSIINLTKDRVQKGDLTSEWGSPRFNPDNGRISIVFEKNGTEITKGISGSVVILNFSVVGVHGATSAMNISRIQLSDLSGAIGTASARNGTFMIEGQQSVISGMKFNDSNGNGIKDPGEVGLANWTIVLKNSTGPILDTTKTDIDGNYTFSGLTEGNYTVEEVLQADWKQTFPEAPGIYNVTLAAEESVTNRDFGNVLNATPTEPTGRPIITNFTPKKSNVTDVIGGPTRTFTINVNQTVDVSWQIDGREVSSQTNVNTSSYSNSSAAPGVWNISALARNANGSDLQAWTWNVKQQIPENGSISGMKFNDSNGNGIKDPGEVGLANWTIVLKNSTGPILDTTKTDIDGNYTFSGLAAGNYSVEEVLQTGWKQTFPEAPGIYNVTLAAGENVTDRDFGNVLNATPTEPTGRPIITNFTPKKSNVTDVIGGPTRTFTINVNQTVDVSWQIDGREVSSQTNVNTSSYSNSSAAPGVWNISALARNANGSDLQAWTWNVKQQIPENGSISGMKFNDSNGNGIKDPGEAGLANWTVVLKNSTGSILDTTMTDIDGNYTFGGLTAGNYTVEEVLQTGWKQTFPEAQGIYNVTLAAGENVLGKDFGNNLMTTMPTGVNAIREIEKESLSFGESTNITVRINSDVIQALVLQESIPPGWNLKRISDDAQGFKNSSNEWVWSNVTPGVTKTVIYQLTNSTGADIGTYCINGTIGNPDGIIANVSGNNMITLDINAYYRRLGSDPDRVETRDLLKAMDDLRSGKVPVGFAHPITIKELSALIDEWTRT